MAIATFLLIAWILNWFNFQQLFIQAVNELFGKKVTTATYYFIFFAIEAFGDIILFFQGTYKSIFLTM
ncbi:hypothetical protein [Paenisporosarcina cavernae]|uniref:Uncharacterized protein n=1 Tax=Paenisporosarcina cavernae TaxID=2320858 RepID=A0A385YXA1_9BACL|nr:hypothetical protein [Paenisporosarcina cavernae]AYC30537.1 hypothetical protein D3873_12110 [Paenisporosarcina cavernae]